MVPISPGTSATPAAAPASRDGAAALERWIRRALAHIGDLGGIRVEPPDGALGRGAVAALSGPGARDLLLDAIAELDRTPGSVSGRLGRHGYALIQARYLEGLPVAEVCARLAISNSEYYRRHGRALALLAAVVAARLGVAWAPVPARAGGPLADAGRTDSPFVGRAAEIARLREIYATAAAGRGGRLVLVSGVMGVGKTRLGQEVGRRAEAAGGQFLAGRYLPDAGATYGPWVEALTPALAALGPVERAGAAYPYAALLAQLFPQLGTVPAGAAGDLLPPEDRRLLLHAGLVQLVQALGDRRPLVLLMDDLQWASGLDLLRHLAVRIETIRVLVVATLRQPEFDQQPHLQRVRPDLLRLPAVVAVPLGPLSEDDSVRLVAARLGEIEGVRLGAAVHGHTRGNPFFIEETLRAWISAGGPPAEPSSLPLPESMRAAVLERVGHLGEACARTLAQAAILGERFRFSDLAALSGQDEDALSDAVEAAAAADLLQEHAATGDDVYAFRDDHVREVLYASVHGARRRRWHLRAARAIEAAPGHEGRLADLAHHFSAGGDFETAARWSVRAGEQRAAAYAWDEAAFQFRRALGLWEQVGAHLPERADVCRRLGDVIFFSGTDLGQGIDYLQRSLGLYAELGDELGAATIHIRLGRERASSLDLRARDLPKALDHLEAARRVLEADPEHFAAAAAVCLQLAAAHAYTLDARAALAAAARGHDLARQAGDAATAVLAEGLHGSFRAATGRVGDGLARVDRAYRAALANRLNWHTDVLLWFRCFSEGYVHPARVAALADHMPPATSSPSRLHLPVHVLGACAYTGDLPRGEALRAQVAETLAASGLPTFGPDPQHCGRLLLRRGDWEAAEELLSAGLAWSQGSGSRAHEALVGQVRGELYLARGELRRAEAALAASARLQRDGAFVLGLADCLASHGRCLAELGQLPEAEATLAELQRTLAAPEDWGRLSASAALAEGVIRSRQDRRQEAEDAFRRALDGFRAEALRWDEALTLQCWAYACEACGGHGAELLEEAQGLWAALGAGRYGEACLRTRA